MFSTILVSYDGSDAAMRAITTAVKIAGAFDGRVHVVHSPQIDTPPAVVGPFVGAMGMPPTQAEIAKVTAEARRNIEALVSKQGGVLSDCIVLRGDPVRNTLDTAEKIEADLIVMGRRGLGAFGALALGSVSQSVSHHATCAVLTVM